MIIFHEGLPRSGKSFAAMQDHIVPSLKKGRKVFCYVEGLDHSKIAELAEITEERCRELLVQLKREDVPVIYDKVEDDAFVVIDELQNFFPNQRKPLDSKITQFVSEHGHRGLDILCMGQLLSDCHSLWRNRTEQKITFIKRNAIGKENEYKWIVYKGIPDSKGRIVFNQVTEGKAIYDEKFFNSYRSHEPTASNTANYQDNRANIFNSPLVKKWLPIFTTVLVLSVIFLIWAFKGGGLEKSVVQEKTANPKVENVQVKTGIIQNDAIQSSGGRESFISADDGRKTPGIRPEILPENYNQPVVQNDYVEMLCSTYRIRLGGFLQGQKKTIGYFEWRDDSGGIKEQLSINTVTGFGWLVLLSPDGSAGTISKNDKRYVVTAWPVQDQIGRVNEYQNAQVRGEVVPPGFSVQQKIAYRNPDPVRWEELPVR